MCYSSLLSCKNFLKNYLLYWGKQYIPRLLTFINLTFLKILANCAICYTVPIEEWRRDYQTTWGILLWYSSRVLLHFLEEKRPRNDEMTFWASFQLKKHRWRSLSMKYNISEIRNGLMEKFSFHLFFYFVVYVLQKFGGKIVLRFNPPIRFQKTKYRWRQRQGHLMHKT